LPDRGPRPPDAASCDDPCCRCRSSRWFPSWGASDCELWRNLRRGAPAVKAMPRNPGHALTTAWPKLRTTARPCSRVRELGAGRASAVQKFRSTRPNRATGRMHADEYSGSTADNHKREIAMHRKAVRLALLAPLACALFAGSAVAQDWTKSKWGPDDEVGS